MLFFKELTLTELDSLISNIPGHIYWEDCDGMILWCNKEQAIFAGFSSVEEMIGKTDYDLPWKDTADEITKLNQLVIKTKKKIVREESITLKNGKKKYFQSQKIPRFDEKGKVIGILGISIDITEQKEAEKLRKEKETEEANKEKQRLENQVQLYKQLSATIAHELVTPLRGIELGMMYLRKYLPELIDVYKDSAQTLVRKKIPNNELTDLQFSASEIVTEVKKSLLFIDMLLHNIRPEKLVSESHKNCFIAEVVEGGLARYPFQREQREKIHTELTYNFEFKGNQELMVHVLFNLLKNALHYLEKAGKGEITIWTQKTKQRNELHFKDTGQGIPADILPRIFEQFFSRTFQGTGIGLTYSKTVMESFGGDVTCKSAEGEYAEFILSFPKVKN